ncbi:MAG TPA: hypothetical protein VIG66_10650 [Noviherbaspirillum sp.]
MSHNANHNPVLKSLRRLEDKYTSIADQQHDFIARQAKGENPDPDEFMKLLEQQSVTHTAMTAQFNLIQKPLKTVITDSR